MIGPRSTELVAEATRGAAARVDRRRADSHDSRASDVGRGGRRGGARDARRGDTFVTDRGLRWIAEVTTDPSIQGPNATDVVMPQMGESIAEGTIVRWIKKVGDTVDRDEPLFEISTDKVDAEIPSPAAGVVSEIRVKEGETVAVNSVVAVIGAAARPTPRQPRRRGAEPPVQAARRPSRRRRRRRPTARPRGRRSAAAAALSRSRRARLVAPPAARRSRSRDAPRAGDGPPRRRTDRPRTRSASDRRRWCARSPRSTTSTSRRSTAPGSRAA